MRAVRKFTALSVRVEPWLKEALGKLASEDHRTLSSLVEKVLADFVKEHGHKPVPPKPTSGTRRRRPKLEAMGAAA